MSLFRPIHFSFLIFDRCTSLFRAIRCSLSVTSLILLYAQNGRHRNGRGHQQDCPLSVYVRGRRSYWKSTGPPSKYHTRQVAVDLQCSSSTGTVYFIASVFCIAIASKLFFFLIFITYLFYLTGGEYAIYFPC